MCHLFHLLCHLFRFLCHLFHCNNICKVGIIGYHNSMKLAIEHLPAAHRQRQSTAPKVTMSNALTRAAHGLSLPEMRLVALAVSKMNSRASATVPDGYGGTQTAPLVSELHARDYAEAFGGSINNGYHVLEKAAISLMKKQVAFFQEAHRRGNKKLKGTIIRVQWVGRSDYIKEEGKIIIYWYKDIVPHLLDLRKHFTVYRLAQIKHLKHKSAVRLLALLERFKSTGVAEYDLEDFCMSMDAAPSFKKNFGMLRRRIIDPAVTELNKHADLDVSYDTKKTGKKVTGLRFTFEPSKQKVLDLGI